MIEYKYRREEELLREYAAFLHDIQAEDILQRGQIETEKDARVMARFYWRMVDASLDDDIEDWLERIHNSLYSACGNAGFGDAWNEEVPED